MIDSYSVFIYLPSAHNNKQQKERERKLIYHGSEKKKKEQRGVFIVSKRINEKKKERHDRTFIGDDQKRKIRNEVFYSGRRKKEITEKIKKATQTHLYQNQLTERKKKKAK